MAVTQQKKMQRTPVSPDQQGVNAAGIGAEAEWRDAATRELRDLPQPIPGMLPTTLSVIDVTGARQQRLVALSQVLALRTYQDLRYGLPHEGPPGMGILGIDVFRQRYLPRQLLLAPDAVAGWVARQAKRDGAPSLYLSGVSVQPEQITWDAESGDLILGREGAPLRLAGLRQGSPAPNTLDEAPSWNYRWLPYRTPQWPYARERVRAGGVLNQLRWLALALTSYTLWEPQQASVFVLTGLTPIAVGYAALREQKRGRKPPKEMTTKHLALAIFTEEHRGQTLKQRMALWNSMWATTQPDWKPYAREQHFGGDSNQAVRRLMGDTVLDEDRTQGGRKQPPPEIPPLDERGGAAMWRS